MLKLSRMDVYVANNDPDDTSDYSTHRVEIRNIDRLIAEQEGKQHGEQAGQSIAFTNLVLWAALRRMGVAKEPYQVFKKRVIDFDDVDEVDDEKGIDNRPDVDPTSPGEHTS